MEIKCKNCGQFINGDDKYCRFCGCPTPPPAKPAEKLDTRQISDAIQEEKVSVNEEEIANAQFLDYNDIIIKSKGNLNGLRFRSIILAALAVTVCIVAFVCAMLIAKLDYEWNNTVKYVLLMISIIVIFIALIYILEFINKIRMYSSLTERTVIIPRFSLRGTPLFVLGGFVFAMDICKPCPECDGEIIGDLHFERIHDRLVAVCNFNRKHIYCVNEKEFFDYCLGKIRTNSSIDIQSGNSENKSLFAPQVEIGAPDDANASNDTESTD